VDGADLQQGVGAVQALAAATTIILILEAEVEIPSTSAMEMATIFTTTALG
jgi:hypothetical protein